MLDSFIALLTFVIPTLIFGDSIPCILCFIERYIFLLIFFSSFFTYYFYKLRYFTYLLCFLNSCIVLTHFSIILHFIKVPKFCSISSFYFLTFTGCIDTSISNLCMLFFCLLMLGLISLATWYDC